MDSWVLTPYPPAVAPPTSPTFLTSSWLQTREWAQGRPADKARSGASPTSSPQNHLEEKNGYCSKPFSLGDLWHSKKLIHLLAVWFWASHLISLNLYHFTGKMEILFILQMGVKQRHSKCSVKWVLLPITPWSCLRYFTLCPYSLSPSPVGQLLSTEGFPTCQELFPCLVSSLSNSTWWACLCLGLCDQADKTQLLVCLAFPAVSLTCPLHYLVKSELQQSTTLIISSPIGSPSHLICGLVLGFFFFFHS